MVDVRRIVAEVLQQRRITVGPGCEEELLVQTFETIRGRTDAFSVRQQHPTHAARTVIDPEAVPHPGELAAAKISKFLEIARIEGLKLVVEEDRELAEAERGLLFEGIAPDYRVEV
ncbi:hypothetical protein [Rubrimonas cliftonensis]|uniref:hypothetical protein n=1 Tax=Rubrimonas cliftonensis TaxID=89524 RepID=UPI0011146F11|nr:hypothetical protein [Rubrimonas cliftonensis]